jgi:hypothetical protein
VLLIYSTLTSVVEKSFWLTTIAYTSNMTASDDLKLILIDPKLGTLSPLPPNLRIGLIPVAALGLISFIAAVSLFSFLAFRMIQWKRQSRPSNQFVFLIANLLFADIQQSIAFLLNAKWLVKNAIQVGTSSCWAQGCKSPTRFANLQT